MCLRPGQKAKASLASCRHNRLDGDQRHIGIAFAATGMCGATTAMRQCAVLGVGVVAEAYALMRLCFLAVSACGENGHLVISERCDVARRGASRLCHSCI